MNSHELKPLLCPFCGAPQRGYIPTDTVQIKCQYCRGIFLVPPWMGGGTYRCLDHPERAAIGKCNDCGESFCGDCLHVYNLNTESSRLILYLCPRCLRRRQVEKTDAFIYVGITFILSGILAALVVAPFGAILSLVGVVAVVYGFLKRGEIPEEITIEEMRVEKEKRKSELASTGEDVDTKEVYNRLLSQYIDHWGVQTGKELLESEIMAYTRRGVSFTEAVKRVHQRQEKKTP